MPADLPHIGTRWGDLTDEQRAALPVGTVLGPPPDHQEWGTLTRVRGGWLSGGEDSYLLKGAEVLWARPILSYPAPADPDPRPSTVTVTLTPALYARADKAGMPKGERAIAEWLVSRAEAGAEYVSLLRNALPSPVVIPAAAPNRGVYPHTTTRHTGVAAFCRCGHAAIADGATWGDDCPLALRAALATARAEALEEASVLLVEQAKRETALAKKTLDVPAAVALHEMARRLRTLAAKKEAP